MVDHSESLSDVPVGGAVGNAASPLAPALMEEEAEELRSELSKVWGPVWMLNVTVHGWIEGIHSCPAGLNGGQNQETMMLGHVWGSS